MFTSDWECLNSVNTRWHEVNILINKKYFVYIWLRECLNSLIPDVTYGEVNISINKDTLCLHMIERMFKFG